MQNMQFIYLRKRNEETVLKHAPFKNRVQLNPCSAAGDLFAYVIFFELETIFFSSAVQEHSLLYTMKNYNSLLRC